MRRLRQVLLVEANATHDQVVCTVIEECVRRLSCGDQHFGRYEAIKEGGVDVKVTIIGHAQSWEDADLDAPKVSSFAVQPAPKHRSEADDIAVTKELMRLRGKVEGDAMEQGSGDGAHWVINRAVPALDYAISVLRGSAP